MKKTINISVLFFCFVFSNTNLHAQYSEGGNPFSFSKAYHYVVNHNIKVDTLPTFNLAALQAEDIINDENKAPYRFGYNHSVNYNLTNSSVWITLPNGDRLWRLTLKSAGAVSINLAFDDFFMPKGGKLFIYNTDKSFVMGAFTEKNNQDDKAFATDILPGDEVTLEYYEPAEVAYQGRIQLFRVTHGYRGLKDYLTKSFDAAGTCQNNINCPLGENWQEEKNAVLFLIVNGGTVCSAALVNDVPQDSKPYVLTANHCSSSGYNTWVFRFGWEAPDCTNPASSPASFSLTGCISRAVNPDTDMSLVEITGGLEGQTIPASYNPYFAGWNATSTPATSTMCIHHPSGDIKKISEAANTAISVTYDATDCWRVGQWTSGTTEAGSSGSPLFDQDKRIVGQLYGGPSGCGAGPLQLFDNYGKFSASWLGGGTPATQLKYWLDPDTTGILFIDGTDSLTLSTNDIQNKSKFTFDVYPNPNSGNFTIQVHTVSNQNITISIFDLLGQPVYSTSYFTATNGRYNINQSTLKSGIYFVEVVTENERHVKKVNIIQ